jgi:UDP-glucose 4-epimerase
VQDPLTTTAVNIEGTLNVLLAARDESVQRIVNASSSSVYGNAGALPKVEAQSPDPISPYAVAKLAAERFCTSFSRVYEMEIVSLRYFNVFGPRQDPASQYAEAVGVHGEIVNIATGGSITVNALADAIGDLLGRAVEKVYEPAREADVRASWADLEEARRVLGYEPQVTFEEGLRRTADHLLDGKE